jgi:probable HAF family extracellular repeat protein
MKGITTLFTTGCLGLLFAAGTCFAQKYTVMDLGTLGGSTYAYGINASGQVVGESCTTDVCHAFRTAPNSPINPATDDLGTLVGDAHSRAYGINASGQVVGVSYSGAGERRLADSPSRPKAHRPPCSARSGVSAMPGTHKSG